MRSKYYNVTLIEEYPIYEPAEGGYYYTGEECRSVPCKTRKEARKILKEIGDDYWLEKKNEDYYANYSKYIGGNVICRIEKKYVTKSRGREPYC